MRWFAIAMLSATVAHARPGVVQQSPGGGGDVEGDVAVHRNDDIPLTLGNTAAAPDAKLLWDTSGTHQLQIWLTDVDGGGTDGVPIYWLTGDWTTYIGANLALVAGQAYVTPPTTHTPTGTTQTIDWDDGNVQVLDLGSASGNVTVTLSNGASGGSYLLLVIQGATARTITWPASVAWPGGTAPTISTTDDDEDMVSLNFIGSTYYGTFAQDFQ